MAKDTPTFEPRSFVAGATVSWSKSLEDYPASEYTLKYALRGPDTTGIDVTATADPVSSDDYLITISASTSDVDAGAYRLVGWVEKGSERYYVYDSQVIIQPAPAAGALDTRSDAEIIYAQLLNLWQTKSLMIQEQYTIAGRQMQFTSYTELLTALQAAAATVRAERQNKRAAAGGDFFPKVNVRF